MRCWKLVKFCIILAAVIIVFIFYPTNSFNFLHEIEKKAANPLRNAVGRPVKASMSKLQ